jgi:hypothetical protein
MRKVFLIAAGAGAGAGLAFYVWSRRSEDQFAYESNQFAYEAVPAPPAAPPPVAEPPVDPDTPGVAPDPEARDLESELTEETRYERLGEHEREEREQAAERLGREPPG